MKSLLFVSGIDGRVNGWFMGLRENDKEATKTSPCYALIVLLEASVLEGV